MAHRYFPHTQEDVEIMLDACDVESLEELYSDVPAELRLKREYNLPGEFSEKEVKNFIKSILNKNTKFSSVLAGGGVYSHAAPSLIQSIISRSEFLTAYTPYQPEISQGTLQYIFEYQTLISRLTGLEISNASLYDGSTATAEAVMLSVAAARKKNRVLMSEALNPRVKKVVETYASKKNIKITYLKIDSSGQTSVEQLRDELKNNDVAGVVVASPNYYGVLEDFTDWSAICHDSKALFIMNCVAADLATIKSPGEWGADIAVGDAQSLGIPLNFGGPYLGFISCNKTLMRKLPGRIVGMTTDKKGRRAFVLTLQAREQHIRREKATSNICSNQGIMTLYVVLYLSLLGLKGLQEINKICVDGAHWLAQKLIATKKVCLTYPDSFFFNEFCITFSNKEMRDKFFKECKGQNILPGIKVDDNKLLIAVTETAKKSDLEHLCEILDKM